MSEYCLRCDRSFLDDSALAQHVADSSKHHVCHECPKDFASAHALSEHNRQKHAVGRTCGRCDLVFASERDLQGHLRSNVCQPRLPLECPAESCTRTFASVGAMIQHLERAPSCTNSASASATGTAALLASAVLALPVVDHQYQPYGGTFVNTFIDCTHERSSSPSREGEREDVQRERAAPSSKFATEGSWNGSKYECVLCHKTFMSLPVLNRHLRDTHLPAKGLGGRGRAKKVYRCV